jgi:hypothetical protein
VIPSFSDSLALLTLALSEVKLMDRIQCAWRLRNQILTY